MKRISIQKYLYIVFILLIIMLPMFVLADPGDPTDPGDPNCDPLDEKCPIDGGLTALLVLGAGYGIKKARDARKEVGMNKEDI